ncbi:glycosyltransferase family 4 protein [Moellerella wisconsensis]|uniref:glycosyltransferase family 4 protein n=1 Tax=Moellerella wisconsensis TaxID=158849 RepID=UPI0030765EEE
MNILFICNEYPPYPSGGIGVFTRELAIELANSGNNVYIIGLYPTNKKSEEYIDGIKIIRLPEKRGFLSKIKNRILLYREIKKTIKKNNIQILECPDFNGLLAFTPSLNCKIITRLHGSIYYFNNLLNTNGIKKHIWYFIEKSSIKKSDNIISVSKFTSEYTKKIFNLTGDIHTIYNGVTIKNNFSPKAEFNKIKTFIFAGSLIRKKGIIELIDAWIKFSSCTPNVKLEIYGKDIENLSLLIENKLNKTNCHSVTIHPPVDKNLLEKKYIKADFCIFPTRAEAFSLAPMEAMSMSKVVLYTNQTSSNELMTNNFNGIIIDKCTPESILDALINVNNMDIKKYNQISFNAFNTIYKNFNVIDKNIENINFYEKALNNEY